jgi:enoyl-CoA hydratase
MRAMVYTSATATAAELHAFGSVLQVVPRAELRDAAMKVAESIADKHPTVIRAAKESLNGIDLWDVKRSYRFEQGFTFELNLTGVADELRDDFAGTDKKNQKDGK